MKIFFVRHGETDANAKKIMMGQRIDEPLNEFGRRQAEELASLLPNSFDIIFSSPLKRTAQTAEIISKKKFQKWT